LREHGVLEIESQWTARDREWKMFDGPVRSFLCPVSVQKTDANPGRQAPGHATGTLHVMLLFSPVEAAGIMRA
jgi:hypothetical protein